MLVSVLADTIAETVSRDSNLFNQAGNPRVMLASNDVDYRKSVVDQPVVQNFLRERQAIDRDIAQLSRTEILRFLLHKWKEQAGDIKCRILICMNAIDLLYNEDGKPKNAEIGEIVSVLNSADYQDLSLIHI